MSFRQAVFRNTAIQVVGKISGIFFSLITAALVFRYLGDRGFGQYTGILAFLQLFGIMMDGGLYIVLLKTLATVKLHGFTAVTSPLTRFRGAKPRTVPPRGTGAWVKSKNDAVVNSIFTLRIFSGIIFLGVAPVVAWIFGRANDFYSAEVITTMALATLFYFCISLNQLLSAIFQKALRTDWIALGEFVAKMVLLGATFLVIRADAGLFGIIFTLVLSAAVNVGMNLWASRKYIHLRLSWDTTIVRNILRDAWPVALSIIFTTIYFKGDSVLLTFFEDARVIGWYGAPYKLIEVLITFPAMFAGLILPVLTAAWQRRDHSQFRRVFQTALDAMSIVVFPLIAGTIFLAPSLILFIAGEEFRPAIPILAILIIACGAIFFGTLLGYLVVALEQQRSMLKAYGFIAVSSLVGYLVLIPQFSLYGAAWVTVYSEMMVVVLSLGIILRTTRVRVQLGRMAKALVAAAGMLIALALVHRLLPSTSAGIELGILIPLGCTTYLLILLALRGVRIKEIKELFLRS